MIISNPRYWNEPYFKALGIIREASEKAGLTTSEVALRWVSHHSLMKREFGDAVLIGASSRDHIEQVKNFVVQCASDPDYCWTCRTS